MKVSSIRWGVIWIGIGFLFLAINFEVMDSLVFPRLFSLWPVLLIAIGVELIFRRTKLYFLALISPLLIAAAFIAAASYKLDWGWNFETFFHGWTWNYKGEKVNDIEIPIDVEFDTLYTYLDCGNINFDINPSTNTLFAAKSTYVNKSPLITNRVEGSNEHVSYEYRDKTRFSLFGLLGSDLNADFAIVDRYPVKMNIDTRAKNPEIDLAGLRVTELKTYLRSNELKLHLGAFEDSLYVQIQGSADKLSITAPEILGIKIFGRISEPGTNLADEGFVKLSDSYESDGYQDATRKAAIFVDARLDLITVTRE